MRFINVIEKTAFKLFYLKKYDGCSVFDKKNAVEGKTNKNSLQRW